LVFYQLKKPALAGFLLAVNYSTCTGKYNQRELKSWPQLPHPPLAYHHIRPLLLHPLCYELLLMEAQCWLIPLLLPQLVNSQQPMPTHW
jgi:hypothetical protein